MKTILLGILTTISINCFAQKKSVLLDLTQTSLLSPVLVYNIYTPFTYNDKLAFVQLGIGGQYGFRKEYFNFGLFDLDYEETYDDNKAVFAYSGGLIRFGAFSGKVFTNDRSKLNLKKIMYAGVGGHLKYLVANNMKSDYGYAGDDEDANKSYRIQNERMIVIAPFFNAGVQLFKKKIMAEWYTGFQANIKIRNKEIKKEYIITNHPYAVTEKGPYNEKETNILPSFLLGFRLGSLLK